MCSVLFSGCPNKEIGRPFIFNGLIIGTCSYFGADSATYIKHWGGSALFIQNCTWIIITHEYGCYIRIYGPYGVCHIYSKEHIVYGQTYVIYTAYI
jgi:hypothetical protein